ncbi:hypothetical protein BADSM9389_41560 [Buttiauxella agrestis]|nr:hypothetical protein BADSM9389_41560 [Buttiauxella agrestis]
MPAIIMGTEHAIVTTMVRTTLRINVIAANNLDINKFFRWLESVRFRGKNNTWRILSEKVSER